MPAREIPSGIYGVTGMMLGILGLITAPVLVGLVIGLIAFALSVVGIRRTRKSDLMLWPSVAGVIVSSMAVLVGVLFVVAFYDTAYI
ncbi:hypothetical protein [Actinospica robiniae]|uniref:hypothetical protein n=1 Tax=Actinospica robiniae TaxID=304901 RepID=UPI0012FB8C63|nr:hypothetical protein [Actinospica robiniae]